MSDSRVLLQQWHKMEFAKVVQSYPVLLLQFVVSSVPAVAA
jgi:hypothetical protein